VEFIYLTPSLIIAAVSGTGVGLILLLGDAAAAPEYPEILALIVPSEVLQWTNSTLPEGSRCSLAGTGSWPIRMKVGSAEIDRRSVQAP
jgi:hypothetical protein